MAAKNKAPLLAQVKKSISPESDFALPKQWGNDLLTQFLKVAHENTYYSANAIKAGVKRVRLVLETFHRGRDVFSKYRSTKSVTDAREFKYDLAAPFLVATESSLFAAANLAMSQQLVEAYKPLRACLETACYGFFMNQDTSKWDVWASRPLADEVKNDSSGQKRKLRAKIGAEFGVANIVKQFPEKAKKLGESVLFLYDKMIDLGGHYNLPALQSVGSYAAGQQLIVSFDVIGASQQDTKDVLGHISQVGVDCLRVLDLAFNPIWKPAGITDQIAVLYANQAK